MSNISLVGIIISLIFISIGAFYAYRCWMLWNKISSSSIGVAVTMNRSFLQTNFKLVLVTGALIGLHSLYVELAEHFGLPSTPFGWNIFYLLYYLKLAVIMLAILILASSWHKFLLKVNHWNTRGIQTK